MVRLDRKASLVLLLLLASVGTVSAECGWVVWQREISEKPDGVWVPREGFKDVAECKAQESKADHRYNPQTRTMEPIPGGHTICLPDTIDPRGPKPLQQLGGPLAQFLKQSGSYPPFLPVQRVFFSQVVGANLTLACLEAWIRLRG